MTKTNYVTIGVVIVIGTILLYWYIRAQSTDIIVTPPDTTTPTTTTRDTPETQVPNPASVYCVDDRQGELQIVETETGQVGMCHLPDGRWCEEWELFRNGNCILPDGVSEAVLYSKG